MRLLMATVAVTAMAMVAWTFRTTSRVEADTAEVSAGSVVRRILATGTLQAVTTVDVGSQVTGIISSLDADFNSIVRANQVIARLDPSLLQAALDQARANLIQAQAAVAEAQANLSGFQTTEANARVQLVRAEQLAASQLIQQADLDAARIAMNEATADVHGGMAQLENARAGVVRAEAAVRAAAVDLEHTVIRSPIDGIVLARNVEVGQTMSASLQAPVLFSIANLTHMQVQVDIDESDLGGIETGAPATFTVESYPDEEFRGVITQLRLQPTVAASVVTYTAIVAVDNPDGRLRPGLTAEVSLNGLRKDGVVRIPNSALAFRPSAEELQVLGQPAPRLAASEAAGKDASARARTVWRYDGKRFTPVTVTVGLADEQWSELLGGSLHPGDALVTSASVEKRRP